MSFNEELQKRIDNDNHTMKKAFLDLTSIINKGKENFQSESKRDKTFENVINEVLSYLGVKNIEKIPDKVENISDILEYLLRPSGIMHRRVELTGDWWNESFGILMGSLKNGDPVALLPAFPTGYKFYDEKVGKYIKINKKNSPFFAVDAFCFYKSFPSKKLNLPDLSLFMLKSVSRRDIVFVLAASFLVVLLGLFMPFINKQIFDMIVPSGIKSNIFPLAALLIGVTAGSTFFKITRSMILTGIRDKINISVFSAAMARMFSLPASFFKDYSAGELSSHVMSINGLCAVLSDSVLSTGLTAILSFVYIFQMAGYAPDLVKPGLLFILFMVLFLILNGYLQQKLSNEEKTVSAKLNGLVFGLFSGIQKIKLAGAEKRAFAKWAGAYKGLGKLKYSPPFILKINKAVYGMLVFGSTIILYYYAGIYKVSASDYIAFSVAYGALSGAIMSVAGIVSALADIKPLLKMIRPIMEAVPEINESKKQVKSLSGSIEMSNVSFRYSQDAPQILNNISLKIDPGEYVAVVGSSGSGKSTMMRLLLGFEIPESGAVYYDGNDLNTLDVRSVRKCIGTCLQNGKIFSGDIFSNIIITAPWSTMSDAWKAAEMSGLAEDIREMPMEMHTVISEGSGSISGGQRQRILIARALIGNPSILFFDEATSALDNLTQKLVAENLSSLGCTRIVIAHRLSTVINCDRIIVLDKGKIAEEGNYESLMEKKGLFYEFAVRQIS